MSLPKNIYFWTILYGLKYYQLLSINEKTPNQLAIQNSQGLKPTSMSDISYFQFSKDMANEDNWKAFYLMAVVIIWLRSITYFVTTKFFSFQIAKKESTFSKLFRRYRAIGTILYSFMFQSVLRLVLPSHFYPEHKPIFFDFVELKTQFICLFSCFNSSCRPPRNVFH